MKLGFIAAGLAAVGLVGTGVATALPAETAVRDCLGAAQVEPEEIVLTCADAGAVVHDLSWSSWDAQRAEGIGVADVATCEPDCATGGRTAQRVRVVLDRPADRAFTRAVLDDGTSYELPARR
ncbi:hypothetical protein ABT337_27420 [Saccharopolyspora hirsuta]|uniref:Secreted protein n=1 Tax=Saccharopolyspora hirsuta TaxID=1837 RepID=A0A5M7CF43_SACHI|nr:hypothetical protein [Saccharopolyspora hirsuta]KAA5837055.1 hypothetical protein F1721_04330 [Saccharopolyspora hirsuta]